MSSVIETRAKFDLIRYANCWEDADILLEAIGDLSNGSCLSIASAGDNALAMLALNPQQVVALDISIPQLALTELKKVCFSELDLPVIYSFLGVKGSEEDRLLLYRKKLRSLLSQPSREFWDKYETHLSSGIIFNGKFEHYFGMFRKYVLRLIHSEETINAMLQQETEQQQNSFYKKHWNTLRWRLLFRLFFNRQVMGHAGRDPEFFKYVEKSVSQHIFKRVEVALQHIPGKCNPYLQFILKGNYTDVLPFYLRQENFDLIRKNLDALEIIKGNTHDVLKKYNLKWNAFNLSDIFEYMPAEIFKSVAAELVENARPGARFVYWNMLVPRSIAEIFPQKVSHDINMSDHLFKKDKAFFYQSFHVDRMR